MNKIDLSKNTLAQMAHVGWGCAGVLLFTLFGYFILGTGAMVAFASLKEGVFDPLTETPAAQGSGWEDFAFWCVGILIAVLMIIIRLLLLKAGGPHDQLAQG
jgi:hypothetical protein